jgi:hypothetical protein
VRPDNIVEGGDNFKSVISAPMMQFAGRGGRWSLGPYNCCESSESIFSRARSGSGAIPTRAIPRLCDEVSGQKGFAWNRSSG